MEGKKKRFYPIILFALAQTETVAVIQSNCEFSARGSYTAEAGISSGCIHAAVMLQDGWLRGSSAPSLAEINRNEKLEQVGGKNEIFDRESE